ncbi:aldose reductase-like [Brachionus plicatilis]|uniref:Aldose reductase-like n=1 Tax=Brachionus plicatilis TaxID=10195 RepID=A0A3M7SEF3_BRAPC|nr:aldose reductase-like [Brachionus plicatilis]
MEKIEIKNISLNNGIEFPLVGLGTFRNADDKKSFKEAVKYAIKSGYRHLDGAWLYDIEDAIGEAIKEVIQESNGDLKREDLFIVSKIWNTFHSREAARQCLNEILANLGTSYVDLLLVHWPMGFSENLGMGPFPKDEQGNRLYSDVHYLETYRALEEFLKEGKAKSIGVSNFNIKQLQDVLDNCEIKPVNNQIEVTPYLQNDKLVEFCQKNGVVVSAYGPLGGSQKSTNRPDLPIVLENPVIVNIGKKYGKTPAQICLRWCIQRNIVVLPKSSNPQRMVQNVQIFDFELSEQDMQDIKKLEQNYRVYSVESLKDHKFYPFNEE